LPFTNFRYVRGKKGSGCINASQHKKARTTDLDISKVSMDQSMTHPQGAFSMTDLALALAAAGIAPAPAPTASGSPALAFNGRAIEPWETMTLEEAGDRVDSFYSFVPRGCRNEWGDKYELGVEKDDPAYLAAREAHRKVYQALERAMKAKGIEPQTPESYEFVRNFRPMNHPEV
jgi:hypothetical protein